MTQLTQVYAKNAIKLLQVKKWIQYKQKENQKPLNLKKRFQSLEMTVMFLNTIESSEDEKSLA